MKKTLVILALAIVSFANAQKGSVLVMGSIEYNSQKSSSPGSENEYNFFAFAPKVGYQFHENWTAGIETTIATGKTENYSYDQKENSFSLGGFLRYSKPLNQTFSAYADLGVGYVSNKSTMTDNDFDTTTTIKGNGYYIGVTPAIFINVNKGFGLNFNIGGLGYSAINYDENRPDYKNFRFSFGQAISVGISKNF